MDYIDEDMITTDAGTFRVRYMQDEDPMSPRDADNVSVIVLDHEWVGKIDNEDDTAGRLVAIANGAIEEYGHSVAAVQRYLRMRLGAWHVFPLRVGFDKYTPTVEVDEASTERGVDAPAGWVFDTPTRREVMIGEHDVTRDEVATYLRQDVDALSRYTSGEYVGYMIERLDDPDGDAEPDDDGATWSHVDSLWSIDSIEYARDMAGGEINALRPEQYPSPALAAQV